MTNEIPELLPANLNIEIWGPHVLMRPISSTEITSKYIGWLNDPDINKYLEVRYEHQTERSVVEYINSLRRRPELEMLAILTKKDQRHIGNMTITQIDRHRAADYGLMMGDQNAWKMGVGAEGTALMLELLFCHMNVRRISAIAYAKNYRATDILERFGYVQEGLLRQHVVGADGDFDDLKCFGMLDSEWTKNRKIAQGILKRSKFDWL